MQGQPASGRVAQGLTWISRKYRNSNKIHQRKVEHHILLSAHVLGSPFPHKIEQFGVAKIPEPVLPSDVPL
jgi:hypothetical protein